MAVLFSLLSGLLFGTGLIVSGMANPAKVLGFLDITRAWDPSLALVMGGAITVGLAAFWLASRRERPVFDEAFHLPGQRALDKKTDRRGYAVRDRLGAGRHLPRSGAGAARRRRA